MSWWNELSWWEIILLILAVLAVLNIAASWIAQQRHPPIGQFITVDGIKVHYLERGVSTARPLVLLHGNGSMIADFVTSGLIDLAAARYRVIAFDRPGFGYSERLRFQIWTAPAQAALLAKALDALDIREPIVLGHSWGTLVALALAARRSVKGVVVVSGYYFPTFRKDVWLVSGPAIPILGDIIAYTIAPVLSLLLLPFLVRSLFAPSPVTDRFKREFPMSLMLRPWHLRAAAEDTVLMIPSAALMSAVYNHLQCPIVVLAGDGDKVVEPEQASRLHRSLPKATMETEPGVGHMLHHAVPQRVMDAIDVIETSPA